MGGRPRGTRLARFAAALCAVAFVFASGAEPSLPPVPDLSGAWALLQATSQIGPVPIVGDRTRTTTSVALAAVTQQGSTVSATQTACKSTIDLGTSLVSMDIPRAFTESMPAVTWIAELSWTGDRWAFVRPWLTTVEGAILADPEHDPLPTSPSDPRVIDQDGDGKPGLTVRITVMGFLHGEVYVVQRDRAQLTGTVTSADAIDGLVEWTSEQSVLGASDPIFLGGTAARIDPVAEHSFFRARRVDSGTTCANLDMSVLSPGS